MGASRKMPSGSRARRDLTRGPKDLRNTAIFIAAPTCRRRAAPRRRAQGLLRPDAGLRHARLERIEHHRRRGPSAKLQHGAIRPARSSPPGRVTAGTGPVGVRAAGLLAQAGADVVITSRRSPDPKSSRESRNGSRHRAQQSPSRRLPGILPARGRRAAPQTPARPAVVLSRTKLGAPRRIARRRRFNAVPRLGIEGIEVTDDGKEREGVIVFGALAWRPENESPQGMHCRHVRAERLVLDAETITKSPRARSPGPESRK